MGKKVRETLMERKKVQTGEMRGEMGEEGEKRENGRAMGKEREVTVEMCDRSRCL